jgi:hypothetical protein
VTEEEKEIFMKYNQNVVGNRWLRMKWVKDKEREYRVDQYRGVFDDTRVLYQNSTNAYVYGSSLAAGLTVISALQAFFMQKFHPKDSLEFSKLINLAYEQGHIDEGLKEELHHYRKFVRNNLAHPIGINTVSTLGFKVKYKGSETGSSVNWSSPDGKPMHPLTFDEVAEVGIELFLRVVNQYLRSKYPDEFK